VTYRDASSGKLKVLVGTVLARLDDDVTVWDGKEEKIVKINNITHVVKAPPVKKMCCVSLTTLSLSLSFSMCVCLWVYVLKHAHYSLSHSLLQYNLINKLISHSQKTNKHSNASAQNPKLS